MSFRKRCITDEQKYNYWKADYSAIREKLNTTNWQYEFGDGSVNDMLDKFVHVINDCVTSCVPLYKSTKCKSKSKWMSRETKRLIKKRDKAWSNYARNKCTKLYKVYKTAMNEVVSNIRKDKAQYHIKLVKRMNNSPKMFTVMFEVSKKCCFCW